MDKSMKPIVKCGRVNLHKVVGGLIATLDRLSYHPKLGPPRCESQTQTSLIVGINVDMKFIETKNTIYVWEDDSLKGYI